MTSQNLTGSADSLSGYLDVGGHQSSFGPVGLVSGTAPPAVHQTRKIATYNHRYNPDPADAANPELQINATGLTNAVTSSGFGIDDISLQAVSNIASGSIVLTDNPLPSLGVLGLSVSATLIHSASDASYVVGANRGTLSGDASFGSLTIGGALIGHTLTFHGDAAANTVLYQSPTVTVTVDMQTLSDFLPPTPVASGSPPILPNRITTDALDIQFNNASLFGTTISGSIAIGELSASIFTSPVVLPPTPG